MKRLFCILLCLSLLFSCGISAMGASFTDVFETHEYYEAIDVLSDFGIILGDAGTGAFRPNHEISRAEFSVIVTRILGVSDLKADLNNLPFTDVTPESCDEWILNATKVAYDMGIIAGYGDGTFGPYNPVTYEQVVKMLVCALGYESSAIENGGWPAGYLVVANDLGITKDAVMAYSENAPRGIVAQLVYNCLEVDLMEKVNETDYQVRPGRNLLTDKLGYVKDEGVVTGIAGKAFTHTGKRIGATEVEIDGEIHAAGETDAKKYFGYFGEFYYKLKNNVKTLISFTPSDRNVVYEVHRDLVEDLDENGITYLENEDASKTSYLAFNGQTVFLYNGLATDLDRISKPNTGVVRMIDCDDDEVIDLIEIKDTRVVVVNALDSLNKTVTNKYNTSEKIVLNPDVVKVKFYKNKSEVEFSAIKKEDVLLIAENDNNITVTIVTATKTGEVSRIAENGEVYYVAGKSYEACSDYVEYMSKTPAEALQVGDKATIYLSEENQILYSVRAELNAKVGYLIAVGPDEDAEKTQIKMLTLDGKIGIYDCDKNMTINGVRYDWDEIEDELKDTCDLTNKDENARGTETSQLIKYELSGSVVSAIYTMVENGDKARELVLGKGYTKDAVYQSSTRSFKDMNLSLSTNTSKVILIPSDRGNTEDYVVATYSRLSNLGKYNIEAYDVSATGVADYLLVYGSAAVSTTSYPALLTDAYIVQNSEGTNVYELKFILNGKEVTRQTKNRAVFNSSGAKIGDIVRYKQNNKGVIEDIYRIFDPEDESFTLLYPSKAAGKRYYTEGTVTTATNATQLSICGTVYSRDEERFVISLGTVNENGDLVDLEGNINDEITRYTINFSSGTKFFVYDKKESEAKRLNTEATKEYIMDWIDSGAGASKVMIYANTTNLRFVYIIVE